MLYHSVKTILFHCFSLGPFEAATGGEMVSRRRILSRSRDDLTQAFTAPMEEEEDVWYQKDKLYKVRILIVNQIFKVSSTLAE